MVGGGLLQLLAYGAQDVYLTGNPNVNGVYKPKFRIYYKKHIVGDIVVGLEIYNVEFLGFEWVKMMDYDCDDMFNFGYKAVNCERCQLTKLPKFKTIETFNKMTHFNCSNNRIKNIKKLMYSNKLIWLNCSYNRLEFIPKKIFSLEYLDFSDNYVNGNVDFSMYPNLKYLMASSNQIKSISNLPNNLKYLDLSNNPIGGLENLPSGLKYLLIVKTKIKSINLIELENLEYLDISLNELNTHCLDGLPSSLIYLNCSQCRVVRLDNLPTSITKLVCVNNEIKTLNMLPETMEYLDCDHNQITKLDDLPNGLNTLICSNNLITELNNLPPKLKKSNDDNNNLDSRLILFKPTYKRYKRCNFQFITAVEEKI